MSAALGLERCDKADMIAAGWVLLALVAEVAPAERAALLEARRARAALDPS